jgi:hypothetical protein
LKLCSERMRFLRCQGRPFAGAWIETRDDDMLADQLSEWYAECVAFHAPGPRLSWTRNRRKWAAEIAVRRRPELSNRTLARETGFSREFIAKIRCRLLDSGQIKAGARIGRDGKLYRLKSEPGRNDNGKGHDPSTEHEDH